MKKPNFCFTKNGPEHTVHRIETDPNASTTLKAGVYRIKMLPRDTGYVLKEEKARFLIPKKIYGSGHAHDRLNFILSERKAKRGTLGVAAIGLKGSGKTLFAHRFSNVAIQDGSAIILVEEMIHPDIIREICTAVPNVVILFNDFDKYYAVDARYVSGQSREMAQDQLLTVVEADYGHPVTFLFTSNCKLDRHFMDRPSRVQFVLEFDLLPKHIIYDVCDSFGLSFVAQEFLFLIKMICNGDKVLFESRHGIVSVPDNLNLDSLLEVAKVLKRFPSIEEAIEYLSFYNTPVRTYLNDVTRIMFKTEETILEEDHELRFRIIDGDPVAVSLVNGKHYMLSIEGETMTGDFELYLKVTPNLATITALHSQGLRFSSSTRPCTQGAARRQNSDDTERSHVPLAFRTF